MQFANQKLLRKKIDMHNDGAGSRHGYRLHMKGNVGDLSGSFAVWAETPLS